MGTRSRIAIENDSGSFTSIYCHWDGYPAHVGVLLRDHYATPERLRRLLALGDLSSLGAEIGGRHSFNGGPPEGRDWCTAYGRDRGEVDIDAKIDPSLEALGATAKNCGAEYLYIFGKDERWTVAALGASYFGMPAPNLPGAHKPLAEVLAGTAAVE